MSAVDPHMLAAMVAPMVLLLCLSVLLWVGAGNKWMLAGIFIGISFLSLYFPLQWNRSFPLDLRPLSIVLACFVGSPLVGISVLLAALLFPVALSDPQQGRFLLLFTYFALGLVFYRFRKPLDFYFRSVSFLILGLSVFLLHSLLDLEFSSDTLIFHVWATTPFALLYYTVGALAMGLILQFRKSADQQYQDFHSRQQILEDMLNSQDGFVRVRDGVVIEANLNFARILEVSLDGLKGALFDSIIPSQPFKGKSAQQSFRSCAEESLQKGVARFHWILEKANGFEEFDVHFLRIYTKDGAELGVFFRRVNVGDSVVAESLATAVFEASREAMLIADSMNNILRVNHAFERVTGYSAEEVIGKNPRILKSDHHDTMFFHNMWESIHSNGFWEGEIWNQKKMGDVFPCHLRISTCHPTPGNPARYIGVLTDLAALAKSEEVLTQVSLFDPLTQLESRAGFLLRLGHYLRLLDYEHQSLAVVAIDIGNFKGINNSYGHVAGDQLLKTLATRLQEELDDNYHFARLGGDEFLAFMVQSSPEIQLQPLFERLARVVRNPVVIDDESVFLSITVGVMIAEKGCSPDSLLKQADSALYEAKHSKSPYKVYDSKQQSQAMNNLLLSKRLKIAIENSIIDVFYQPKIDLRTGRIHGMEALARWKDEQGKFIPPVVFIPLAEQNGLINHLFQVIVSKTVKDMARLFLPIQPDLMVSINLSSHQFDVENLVQEITCRVDHEQIAREHFEFEVTESVFINNMESTRHILEEFKNEGFQLSLDDFGTGYSSLTYLNNLPFDTLKIDKSFVDPVPAEARSNAMTQSIVNLAHAINLRCVAEGVETQDQMDFLRLLDCDYYQGYLYSPPVDRIRFADMLKNQDQKNGLSPKS